MPDRPSLESLADVLNSRSSIVSFFRNETLAPHSGQRAELTPVVNEFTNWIDEQRAWRETAILFDQTHHMPEMFIEGPDAFDLLNRIGINSFKNFVPGKAKQFIACSPEGHIIGDCILFYLDDGRFELVSGMTIQDWVEFQAKAGGSDVSITRDFPTSLNPTVRTNFRFGMDRTRICRAGDRNHDDLGRPGWRHRQTHGGASPANQSAHDRRPCSLRKTGADNENSGARNVGCLIPRFAAAKVRGRKNARTHRTRNSPASCQAQPGARNAT